MKNVANPIEVKYTAVICHTFTFTVQITLWLSNRFLSQRNSLGNFVKGTNKKKPRPYY
eukprot:COSAG02_NODE_830_length_16689_cov_10.438999_6_plen_58_part_00